MRWAAAAIEQLELALWKQAGIEPKGGSWYVESGTGMGQTIADQKRAYTIANRATWLAWRSKIELPILLEGDRSLSNVYHVMPVNPAKFPNVTINASGGQAFADPVLAPETQRVIGNGIRTANSSSSRTPANRSST